MCVCLCVYALKIVSTDTLQMLELLVLIITAGRGSKEDLTYSSLGQSSHVADIISILMHSHICIHTQPVAILFFRHSPCHWENENADNVSGTGPINQTYCFNADNALSCQSALSSRSQV